MATDYRIEYASPDDPQVVVGTMSATDESRLAVHGKGAQASPDVIEAGDYVRLPWGVMVVVSVTVTEY